MGLSVHVGSTPSEVPTAVEINGHPSIQLPNATDDAVTITVCCECGGLRSILWLIGDRWYCSGCKASGNNKPSLHPIR